MREKQTESSRYYFTAALKRRKERSLSQDWDSHQPLRTYDSFSSMQKRVMLNLSKHEVPCRHLKGMALRALMIDREANIFFPFFFN